MAKEIIPAQQIPDQEFVINLGGQDCKIHLYQRLRYIYMDLTVEDKPLFKGKICLNMVQMADDPYYGFNGQLYFMDTQGESDPYYTGFGERWYLVYVQQ